MLGRIKGEGVQECLRPLGFGCSEKFLRRGLLYNFTTVNENNTVCNCPCKLHLMGHNQHGQTLLGQLQYYVQHFSNHFRVQRCGNLIKEHDFRVHAERTDNGHPLLLATGG